MYASAAVMKVYLVGPHAFKFAWKKRKAVMVMKMTEAAMATWALHARARLVRVLVCFPLGVGVAMVMIRAGVTIDDDVNVGFEACLGRASTLPIQ